jgi:hypothetical protein
MATQKQNKNKKGETPLSINRQIQLLQQFIDQKGGNVTLQEMLDSLKASRPARVKFTFVVVGGVAVFSAEASADGGNMKTTQTLYATGEKVGDSPAPMQKITVPKLKAGEKHEVVLSDLYGKVTLTKGKKKVDEVESSVASDITYEEAWDAEGANFIITLTEEGFMRQDSRWSVGLAKDNAWKSEEFRLDTNGELEITIPADEILDATQFFLWIGDEEPVTVMVPAKPVPASSGAANTSSPDWAFANMIVDPINRTLMVQATYKGLFASGLLAHQVNEGGRSLGEDIVMTTGETYDLLVEDVNAGDTVKVYLHDEVLHTFTVPAEDPAATQVTAAVTYSLDFGTPFWQDKILYIPVKKTGESDKPIVYSVISSEPNLGLEMEFGEGDTCNLDARSPQVGETIKVLSHGVEVFSVVVPEPEVKSADDIPTPRLTVENVERVNGHVVATIRTAEDMPKPIYFTSLVNDKPLGAGSLVVMNGGETQDVRVAIAAVKPDDVVVYRVNDLSRAELFRFIVPAEKAEPVEEPK